MRRFVIWFDRPTLTLHFDAVDADTREWCGIREAHRFGERAESFFSEFVRHKWLTDDRALVRAAALIQAELSKEFPNEKIEVVTRPSAR